jgi:hypothetical protein
MRRTPSYLQVVLVLLAGALPLAAQTTGRSSDEAAVRAVLEQYLHGLKFNDTSSLHEAFWADARLFYIKPDSQLGQWTQASWYATFAGSAGKEEQGELRIAALEVTRDMAMAKIVEDYPRSRYTDYISLLRIQGRWWIVNKIYTAERK